LTIQLYPSLHVSSLQLSIFNININFKVFEDVSELVQSALDGHNVTLFSYGQTGSGKTHSMQGSGNEAMRGIIPRAIEQVAVMAIEVVATGDCYWVMFRSCHIEETCC